MRSRRSVKQLLNERGLRYLGDPRRDWETLYLARPDLSSPTIEPVGLPSESGVLGFLYGLAHDELEVLRFTDEERVEVDRAIGFLRTLTDIEIPPVALHTWKEGAVCAEAMRTYGFSCAGEPQLRRVIAFSAAWRNSVDPVQLARVVAHEVHHAAMATIACPPPGVYLQPMVGALDEMAAGFTDLSVLSALSHGGVVGRSFFLEDSELDDDERERRWLRATLALTPGLETKAMCHRMTAIAIEALTYGRDDEGLVEILNRYADAPRSLAVWRDLLRD